VLIAALRGLGGAGGLTAALPLAWSDIVLLSPCPLLAATVALVAARIAAQTTLGKRTLGGRRSQR
jgi:cell division transport system permease protein